MVIKPGKHQRSKQRCQDVGRSRTVHNLLFSSHTIYMNYVTKTLLLVSSSVRSKQLLCFVHGQGQKSEQKPKTKEFVGFHNHSIPQPSLHWRAIFNSVSLRHSLFVVQAPLFIFTRFVWCCLKVIRTGYTSLVGQDNLHFTS